MAQEKFTEWYDQRQLEFPRVGKPIDAGQWWCIPVVENILGVNSQFGSRVAALRKSAAACSSKTGPEVSEWYQALPISSYVDTLLTCSDKTTSTPASSASLARNISSLRDCGKHAENFSSSIA